MWLLRPPGVYRPQGDTWLLARALRDAGVPPGGAVLDIGCGTGALSIAAARTSPRSMTAFDLSRRAVAAARFNTAVRGLNVRVRRGDALEEAAGEQFDLVLANPPYVPGVADLPSRGPRRAWDAGSDGRAMLDRICAMAPILLAPGGVLLTVHSALCDVDRTLAQLRGGGLKASVVARADEPFGPVMRDRVDKLRELGLIDPDQRVEELVVVRGDRLAS
ncbi:HemK2/MTQ2 family protein methyltransferase [Actinophytocola xanthii]|uniref:Methyltransferase n=1 Tax=Actinophytocola xanthii TaxID=1912961 RepID=A0A1Q8CC53_9PSEU|nr:HemK2/MTQ2 family protein methyltransferase [Actinophytocola xanthii]OLF11902.1 methyltransferase [Actinophytocola xanthii]